MTPYLVAQLCARMHYAVPLELQARGALERFHTDLYVHNSTARWLRSSGLARWSSDLRRVANRSTPGIPDHKTHAHRLLGLEYAFRRRIPGTNQIHQTLVASRRFCHAVARGDWGQSQAVYTFNGAGLEILAEARRRGCRTVTEQTIAPFGVEKDLVFRAYAQWGIREVDPRYQGAPCEAFIEREKAEWELADQILCASQFVIDGIAAVGGPVEKCRLVPYGVSLPAGEPPVRPPLKNRPLRVLMVGIAGIRKGTPTLIEAAAQLGDQVEVRIAGRVSLPETLLAQLPPQVKLLGTLPRPDVDSLYAWADVFVLPSLCEGSATVVYEAMGWGLPILTTPNAGSVVTPGQEGLIFKPLDTPSLVEALTRVMEDPDLLPQFSQASRATARLHDRAQYGQRLADTLLTPVTGALL